MSARCKPIPRSCRPKSVASEASRISPTVVQPAEVNAFRTLVERPTITPLGMVRNSWRCETSAARSSSRPSANPAAIAGSHGRADAGRGRKVARWPPATRRWCAIPAISTRAAARWRRGSTGSIRMGIATRVSLRTSSPRCNWFESWHSARGLRSRRVLDRTFQTDAFGRDRCNRPGKFSGPSLLEPSLKVKRNDAHCQSSGFGGRPGLKCLNARGCLKVHPEWHYLLEGEAFGS